MSSKLHTIIEGHVFEGFGFAWCRKRKHYYAWSTNKCDRVAILPTCFFQLYCFHSPEVMSSELHAVIEGHVFEGFGFCLMQKKNTLMLLFTGWSANKCDHRSSGDSAYLLLSATASISPFTGNKKLQTSHRYRRACFRGFWICLMQKNKHSYASVDWLVSKQMWSIPHICNALY
jgi:hypothetical protein